MTRVALLGFSIECNRFAPIATEADFRGRTWVEGEALLTEARSDAPRMLAEMPGFVADMDRWAMDGTGPWTPCPVLSRFASKNLPRPVLPLDAGVTWP